MMQNKLETINQIDCTVNNRDSQKTINALHKLVTMMRDLLMLSKRHGIKRVILRRWDGYNF